MTEPAEPPIFGLLLAAGSSRRMGHRNKLLIEIDGAPVVQRSARVLVGLVERLVVVTGHQAQHVEQALEGLDVDFVFNTEHLAGLGSSLAAGVRGLPRPALGVLVALADMPFVTRSTAEAVLAVFADDPTSVVAPVFRGVRGHPVAWPARCFAALARAAGDVGARTLLQTETITEVPVDDPGVVRDLDTPEDLSRA